MTNIPRQKIWQIVGEDQTNPDGSRRQEHIARVIPGTRARLVREPDNPKDSNAIGVWVNDQVIGYLGREDAAALAPLLDQKVPFKAKVHRIKGGVPDYPTLGVELSIAWMDRPAHPHRPLDDVQIAFIRRHYGVVGWKQPNERSEPVSFLSLLGRLFKRR